MNNKHYWDAGAITPHRLTAFSSDYRHNPDTRPDMAKVVSILVTLEGILNKVAESIEDINRRLSALERKE